MSLIPVLLFWCNRDKSTMAKSYLRKSLFWLTVPGSRVHHNGENMCQHKQEAGWSCLAPTQEAESENRKWGGGLRLQTFKPDPQGSAS